MTSGDLIRHLDNEPAIFDRADDRGDPLAGAELARLRNRAARLSELLSTLDPPEDEVRRSAEAIRPLMVRPAGRRFAIAALPPALRIAAAIAVIVGVGLAVEPARAWVLERLRTAVEAVSGRGGSPGADVVGADAATTAGAGLQVTVPVQGDSVFLEVAGGSGELVIRRAGGTAARLRVSGAPDATLAILSTTVRIGGGASGAAVFELDLPASVAAVIVTRADGSRAVHVLETSDGELRLPLAAR